MDPAVQGAEVLRETTKKVVHFFEKKEKVQPRGFCGSTNVKSWLRAWRRCCFCVEHHSCRLTTTLGGGLA